MNHVKTEVLSSDGWYPQEEPYTSNTMLLSVLE